MKEINELYFEMLCNKAKVDSSEQIPMHCPEQNITSGVIPYSIVEEKDLDAINVAHYSDLESSTQILKKFNLNIVKMQAGLGTSVERLDLIQEVENRTTLGAKGTDLYFDVLDKKRSIAEIQLLQAYALSKSDNFKSVTYQSLVNDETENAVSNIWNLESPFGSSYQELFSTNKKLIKGEDLFQKKMPTFNENGELTHKRLAPAGHGFIGLLQLMDIFENDQDESIVVIGNGEDLNSTPDLKILEWVAKENIAVTMITTTKTIDDTKGGQISIVKGDHQTYVSIIEKAQAQISNQLEYFEQLGLRDGDRIGLFNTNIVVINKKALKDIFNKYLVNLSQNDFISSISPDVIRNIKEQNGKKFTQIESALGSVMLNLDKFMRLNYNQSIVFFLNLDSSERSQFFMPIKHRSDFDELQSNYFVNESDFRIKKK